LNPLSVLQLIGRGAHKASEIASRLGTKQTNLSRVFQQLIDSDIVHRDIPFGESTKNSKRTLYSIVDPALRFWFQVFSPHQTRWKTYSRKEKLTLINLHASSVFEDYCRSLFPGSSRYWEGHSEIDLVAPRKKGILVAEVKWKELSKTQLEKCSSQLKTVFQSTSLSKTHTKVEYRILDQSIFTSGEVLPKNQP